MADCNVKDDGQKNSWSLTLIEIPNPCEVPWNSMHGNDRVRFCDQCSKNVYNISDMSEAQATRLLIDNEGKVCISMLRRADGTVVTDSCPPILRPVRNGYKKLAAVCSAFIALACNQLNVFAADATKKSDKGGQSNSAADPNACQKQTKPQPKSESSCGADTLILKQGKSPAEPIRMGGAIAPPRTLVGTGQLGSHIEVVGYGIDELAKSTYPEELGKQISKQWHPSPDSKKKEVVVSFWMDQTGKLTHASVTSSSGNADADKSALTAVQAAGPYKLPATMQRASSFNVKFPLE